MQVSNIEPMVASAGKIFDRVLVAVDYSMDSHRALGVALELQRIHGSAVRVFHAAQSDGSADWHGGIGSPTIWCDWVTETEGRLRRFLDNIAPGSASRVELGARVGELLHTLRLEIAEWRPTLLVAAARVHRHFSRSPAERLVHDIVIPVMIIPTSR